MSLEITGLIIVKNEEKHLPTALNAWAPLCEEVVVVNDQSIDRTESIARESGALVIDACMDESTGFAGLRNTGLEAVQTSHALVFDADEIPSSQLVRSIIKAKKQGDDDVAYRLLRKANVFGGWLSYGRFQGDTQIRLFSSETRYEGLVHEIPILDPATEIIDLEGHVEHYTYETVSEYLVKMRDYARHLAETQPAPSYEDIVRQCARNLVKKHAYKDGWRGIAMVLGDIYHDLLLKQSATGKQKTQVQAPDISVI